MGAEGAAEDRLERRVDAVEVHRHHDDRQSDVDDGHQRRHPFGDLGHALEPPVEDGRAEGQEDERRRPGGDAVLLVEGVGDRVGLNHLVGDPEGEDEEDGEGHAPCARPQASLDVEGRAAAERAVGPADLEQLGEHGLDEGAGHSQERDQPHPEDGAGSPQFDGDGNARYVPGAHARGDADGEGLKRGDPLAVAGPRIEDLADHPPEQADLDEARADREV